MRSNHRFSLRTRRTVGWRWALAPVAALTLAVVACSSSPAPDEPVCTSGSVKHCACGCNAKLTTGAIGSGDEAVLICLPNGQLNGVCEEGAACGPCGGGGVEAGPGKDAGVEASGDSGPGDDATTEGAAEASPDASPETGPDAPPDVVEKDVTSDQTTRDAPADVTGKDAPTDAVTVDAPRDAPQDAVNDRAKD